MCLGGNFCFCRVPTELRAKGSPGSRVPAGHAFCLSTWNLGVAFPGHPSPTTHPPKHKRACRAPITYGSSGILRKSPGQRQTAPLRAARLTFAQLARRGAPLRPPPRTLRVSRSSRAGSRPPQPRCQAWVPCPTPRALPGSLFGTLALPGSGKVSSSSPPPKEAAT